MRLDVEPVGGPLDGHVCEVEMTDPRFDVRLFTRREDGRREVLAYAFQGRTTCRGKRWVLGFLYAVGKIGADEEKLKAESGKLKEEEEGRKP